MAYFGRIKEFSLEKETISMYLECVEILFQTNAIDDEKKVPVFLSTSGGNVYALLCSLLSPTKPQDKTLLSWRPN